MMIMISKANFYLFILRTLNNLIVWRAINQLINISGGDQLRGLRLKYRNKLLVLWQEKYRYSYCLNLVNNEMKTGLAHLYISRKFPDFIRRDGEPMSKNVLKAFREIVDESDWLDEETKEKAREKIEAMLVYIGYPDDIGNSSFIDSLYANLIIKKDEFANNVKRLSILHREYKISSLNRKNERSGWETKTDILKANAFYYNWHNFILMCLGIFGGSFYQESRPNYMNYASIGSVFGHELTHGFDNNGRNFDKIGEKVDWWSSETALTFTKKARCLIDQYSKYKIKKGSMRGSYVNGINTISENIADNGGIKIAMRAYELWKINENMAKEEDTLPLEWNQKQLFWIAYAQSFCQRIGSLSWKIYQNDPHSIDEARVNVVVSNFPEFSQAFECRSGSRLNPAKRCSLW